MKKLLLSATACLLMAASIKAQEIQPCGTYKAREYYLKNVPGYAAKLNAAEAASRAEYQAFLQQSQASKTASVEPTYTVPVVFHILHQGEPLGTAPNIDDQLCIDALAQVNRDYAKQGIDTSVIDPLFRPLYEDSHMQFMLAQKDPNGNCTNGVVHHFDNKTQWSQSDLSNYQYSTYASGNWNPYRYLNIYIVKNIIASGSVVGGGIIVGYTHLPGTEPVSAADAIVYRNDFLTGLNARALSHEIGHWFGLSHTFGSTNDPGFECGNDDIYDTPATTGFFSTCPKPGYNYTTPSVTNPVDASDITRVKFGKMDNSTAVNSLTGTFIRPLFTMVATTVTPLVDTSVVIATGTTGSYSDFTMKYGNDFNAGSANVYTVSITSSALSTDSNYVSAYIDYNNNGSFADAGEAIFTPTYGLLGTQTYTRTYTIPAGKYGLYRMRVMTSNSYITGPTMIPASGEIEEYNLNVGTTPSPTTGINMTMATCDTVRPNIENIMDYSDCPKMFTKGQKDKVRMSATSTTGNRNILITNENLYFTGIVNRTITYNTSTLKNDTVYTPTTVSPCAPVADFASNKMSTCVGQSILYTNTAYNGTGLTYSWVFEGGTPATSSAAVETVTYSTPGTYSVSLTVTNAYGASTKTISSVYASNNSYGVTLPYSEDFEASVWPPAGWNIPTNPDMFSPTWEKENVHGAGVPETKGLILPNANGASAMFGNAANVDVIELPLFDFSNFTFGTFEFDYSFARKTGVTQDSVKVQYSFDCGGTWKNLLGIPSAAAMTAATGGTVNAPYIPWSSAPTTTATTYKWKTVTATNALNGTLSGKRDVKFRFWFKNDVANGESQNFYIDNINITGVVGIHEFENSLGLSIYPNPTNSAATIEFTSPNNSKVNIIVYDVTGRMVEQNESSANAGVTNKHTVNAAGKLTPGIYFISLMIDNNKVVKKLIID